MSSYASNWILEKFGDFTCTHRLQIGDNTIGRLSSMDIRIGSLLVARRHAVIHVSESDNMRVTLKDLGTTGGTYINDVLNGTNEVILKRNDLIGFGTPTKKEIIGQLPLYFLRYSSIRFRTPTIVSFDSIDSDDMVEATETECSHTQITNDITDNETPAINAVTIKLEPPDQEYYGENFLNEPFDSEVLANIKIEFEDENADRNDSCFDRNSCWDYLSHEANESPVTVFMNDSDCDDSSDDVGSPTKVKKIKTEDPDQEENNENMEVLNESDENALVVDIKMECEVEDDEPKNFNLVSTQATNEASTAAPDESPVKSSDESSRTAFMDKSNTSDANDDSGNGNSICVVDTSQEQDDNNDSDDNSLLRKLSSNGNDVNYSDNSDCLTRVNGHGESSSKPLDNDVFCPIILCPFNRKLAMRIEDNKVDDSNRAATTTSVPVHTEIEALPSSVPTQIEDSPSSVPMQIEASPSSVLTEVEASDSSVPTEIEASPSSVPTEIEASPFSVPTEIEASYSSVPMEIEASDSSVPTEIEASPSSVPTEIEASPSSVPTEIESSRPSRHCVKHDEETN